MAEITTQAPAKTPWHVWVVGGVSLLWNAMGAMDFTLTETRSEAYLKNFTPAQLKYFMEFPLWVVVAWGIATWGSVAGSLLLMLRRGWAVQVNLAVIVGMALTFVYNFILTDGLKAMGGGAGSMAFTAAIVVIGVLLFLYARAMHRRGVLR